MKRKTPVKSNGKQIDKIWEEEFTSIEEMNEWIKNQAFNTKIINIQKIGDESYILFFGKII